MHPIVFLPHNVVGLAKIAAQEVTRYAINSVRVEPTFDGGYRAIATDGKRLLRVTGPNAVEPDAYPPAALPTLPAEPVKPDAPADGAEPEPVALGASLPLSDFVAGCKAAKAGDKRGKRGNGSAACVAVALGSERSALSNWSADGATRKAECANVEGRYPQYGECFPKGAPVISVPLNAALLAELLDAIVMMQDSDAHAVTLEIFGPDKPMMIMGGNSAGQQFAGLIMPVSHNPTYRREPEPEAAANYPIVPAAEPAAAEPVAQAEAAG